MWSQWPWVSSTRRTPRRWASSSSLLVLVGGVEQHGVAGRLAPQDEHVVVVGAHDQLVDLDLGVVVVERHAPVCRASAQPSLDPGAGRALRLRERAHVGDDVEAEGQGHGDLAVVEGDVA